MAGGALNARRLGLALLACAAAACAARPARPSTAAQATLLAVAPEPTARYPTPASYTTPHPAPSVSALDGSYAMLYSAWPQWWRCLRCADYRLAGGIWRLQFHQGTLRIGYDVTGWQSLASYTVEGDRLTVFNDPYCPEVVARYGWQLRGGALQLQAAEDPCAFGLRAETLEAQLWLACESAAYQSSPGCEAAGDIASPAPPVPAGLAVTVTAGDSRFFEVPPRVSTYAGSPNPPAGIRLSFSPDSIGYGLSRVLWWEGTWMQADTDLPFEAMAVQFLGDPQVGWARLMLDGQEIWRGDTAGLGESHSRRAGYVEVSGFGPGPHTLRVEALGWDYRPVTVASFGFR